MKKISLAGLIGSIGICQLAGIVGVFYTTEAIPTWYQTLNKPDFNPPSWIFGPVWLALYTLMGIALYLIWQDNNKKHRKQKNAALLLFFIHLVVNALWSPLFFGMRIIGLALVDIVILWVLIVALIQRFAAIKPIAGYFLVPYFFWVSFAMVLNFSFLILN